jgi:hypothetical protein
MAANKPKVETKISDDSSERTLSQIDKKFAQNGFSKRAKVGKIKIRKVKKIKNLQNIRPVLRIFTPLEIK